MVWQNTCSKKLQTNLTLQNLLKLLTTWKSAIRLPEETQLCHRYHNNHNNRQQPQTFRTQSAPTQPTTPASLANLQQGDKLSTNNNNSSQNNSRKKTFCIYCRKPNHDQEKCYSRIRDNQPCVSPKGNPYWPKNVNAAASPATEQVARGEEEQSAFSVFLNEVLWIPSFPLLKN